MTHLERLAQSSKTSAHERILDMLDYYGVSGIIELTDEQIRYFAENLEGKDGEH